MSYTRAQAATRVTDLMDATGSSRWSTTQGQSGEVQRALGVAFDREWKTILTSNRYYRFSTLTPTSDATTGRYNITDLSSGTGDTQQRFFRILAFVVDNIPYDRSTFGENVLSEFLGLSSRMWWREGSLIMATPKQLSHAATVTVNWFPTRVDQLSADTVTIDFPDGYEDILFLEAAAILLSKGGAETQAAAELRAEADLFRQDMLADIARESTRPHMVQPIDWAYEYGG